MIKNFVSIVLLLLLPVFSQAQKQITDYVNPFLGTATLWDSIDIGYKPTHRTWGAEAFPGSSVPNAMVQLTGNRFTMSFNNKSKVLSDPEREQRVAMCRVLNYS